MKAEICGRDFRTCDLQRDPATLDPTQPTTTNVFFSQNIFFHEISPNFKYKN